MSEVVSRSRPAPEFTTLEQVFGCSYTDFCAWLDAHLEQKAGKPVMTLPPLLSKTIEQILGVRVIACPLSDKTDLVNFLSEILPRRLDPKHGSASGPDAQSKTEYFLGKCGHICATYLRSRIRRDAMSALREIFVQESRDRWPNLQLKRAMNFGSHEILKRIVQAGDSSSVSLHLKMAKLDDLHEFIELSRCGFALMDPTFLSAAEGAAIHSAPQSAVQSAGHSITPPARPSAAQPAAQPAPQPGAQPAAQSAASAVARAYVWPSEAFLRAMYGSLSKLLLVDRSDITMATYEEMLDWMKVRDHELKKVFGSGLLTFVAWSELVVLGLVPADEKDARRQLVLPCELAAQMRELEQRLQSAEESQPRIIRRLSPGTFSWPGASLEHALTIANISEQDQRKKREYAPGRTATPEFFKFWAGAFGEDSASEDNNDSTSEDEDAQSGLTLTQVKRMRAEVNSKLTDSERSKWGRHVDRAAENMEAVQKLYAKAKSRK
eukprot:m.57875 g.57875  ORF g.57875 m.57875 type:complete len:493 (+) comp6857_c0_seq4:21-1499(+)